MAGKTSTQTSADVDNTKIGKASRLVHEVEAEVKKVTHHKPKPKAE